MFDLKNGSGKDSVSVSGYFCLLLTWCGRSLQVEFLLFNGRVAV